ncbi:helix-turn-helix domain-containing protein [Streptomyces coacervatus]|nr:helix-turn-helix domain-containing protein [Streptomyces coacervatus]MDF2269732.1 helix-turn-helix domain-containing protein [Streptomyces coacervatus]
MRGDVRSNCWGVVAEPVRVRRLTDPEGQKRKQIVRRGSTSSVRYRRAMMLLAPAGGNRVPVIARLVRADEDTLRDVIHRFNEVGPACLDPKWAGGRPRLLSIDDEDFVIQSATKGAANTLSALKSIRAARPDGAPIYVILDNLSAHDGDKIRRWATKNRTELCFTPTYVSWANPIEAHLGPLRQFSIANPNHRNHTAQTRALHACLRWRIKNARHPDVLAAQRRERARIRRQKGLRWGRRSQPTARLQALKSIA